jgi:two-component system chemotaxis response regulator CheB
MKPKIRVLIADDSAFARKVVREMLEGDAIEVVGSARDGAEALEMTAALSPDLVVTDLVMPKLDGVNFVRQQMAARPLPILILSSASQDAAEVLEALNFGAIDVVQKPTALATDDLRDIRAHLVAKVLETMNAPLGNLMPAVGSTPAVPPLAVSAPKKSNKVDLVVIGISTGGPQALRRMLPMLPAEFPVPVAIVLHMPVGYTALYAEKLDELCVLDVKEAADGDVLRPGLILLAQAGRHLTFRKLRDGRVSAQLSVHPLEKLHRPSADVLFRSAAEVFGSRTLGVVMTGMGEDGKEGAAWIKAQGGDVLTEAEKSCVIYGMPRSVVEAGLSDAAVPLDQMAQSIIARL